MKNINAITRHLSSITPESTTCPGAGLLSSRTAAAGAAFLAACKAAGIPPPRFPLIPRACNYHPSGPTDELNAPLNP